MTAHVSSHPTFIDNEHPSEGFRRLGISLVPAAFVDVTQANLDLPPTHINTPETRHWRSRYYAAVEKMDADLGQVYDAAYKDLGENTLFIHFSDHGAQWPFGKWNLYDAGTRVPFFAVWPDAIKPGSKSDAMISLVDVLPTLVEAAGGAPPTTIDGSSRLGVLKGESTTTADYIFTTHSGDGRMNEFPMRSVRTPRWKFIRNLRPDGEHHNHIDRGKAIDGNRYWQSWIERSKTDEHARKIIDRYFRRPAEELYDLERDPHEQHNLAGDPAVNTALNLSRSKLDAWMKQQGDQGVATEQSVAEAFKPE